MKRIIPDIELMKEAIDLAIFALGVYEENENKKDISLARNAIATINDLLKIEARPDGKISSKKYRFNNFGIFDLINRGKAPCR